MPWYNGDYPTSYKNQPIQLRAKAVEIANNLIAEGVEEGIAIATALKRARRHFQVTDDENQADRHEIEFDGDELEGGDFENDPEIVDTEDAAQLGYWASQLQVTPEELKQAAAIRGDRISEIKKFLNI